MTATTGAIPVTVEAIATKVVDVAISLQGTDKMGRWETHNNQLKLSDDDTAYNNNEHNDDTMYDDDFANGITVRQTPV